MTEHVQVGGLQVAKVLFDFVNNEAIPGTGITADQFWAGADKVIHNLAPKSKALLAKRDDFQARIDTWHQTHAGQAHDAGGLQSLPARHRIPAARSRRLPGYDPKRR